MSNRSTFDLKSEIVVASRPAAVNCQLTEISVRFPTDQEWATHMRAKKILVRDMGRGVNENVPAKPGEADSKLFAAISLNGAPPLTPAEAAAILDQIGVSKVIDVRLDGLEAEVDMRTMTGLVQHRMKIPTADQVNTFQLGCVRRLDLPFGQHTIALNIEAGAKVYDECAGHSDDYPSGIPSLHKESVARAVIDIINRQLGPRQNDDDF